ncbi:hypothetical protein DEF23_25505, partial [Marinitenerispora sediminis]
PGTDRAVGGGRTEHEYHLDELGAALGVSPLGEPTGPARPWRTGPAARPGGPAAGASGRWAGGAPHPLGRDRSRPGALRGASPGSAGGAGADGLRRWGRASPRAAGRFLRLVPWRPPLRRRSPRGAPR